MRRAPALLLPALLAACGGGEPVRAPEVAVPAQYTATPATDPRLAPGKDIPAEWWTLFRSPALDGLVRRALAQSPTLERAEARLREAAETLSAREGGTGPRVDAHLSAYRADVKPGSLGVQALPVSMPLDLFLATISVSYTFDFAGGTRRELAALGARIDYEGYQVEAARLMLAGNVVTTAIREAALREQIAASEEIVALQAERVAIDEQRERAGGIALAELLAEQRDLADARAALPDLQRDLERLRHRLAVYVGVAPGTPGLPEFRLAELQLPGELPLSLPSELARQRPDIRAAEALLEQAGAEVGVANAHLYPQVTLSAQGGSLASKGSDLFASGTGFYLLGASLVQPLFNHGELTAKRRAAVAAYDAAAAVYTEAVLLGLQNVADALRALDADAARLGERDAAAARARSYRDVAQARYDAGGISRAALLEASRQYRRAELARTQAAADRYADSAALLQALGGGWWNKEK